MEFGIADIIGYMTKVSKWFVVMKVTSEPYFDTETKIWKQASFPCRLKVSVENSLVIEQAIPVLELAPQLKMFDNLKSPVHWGLLFRTAPKRLDTSDGEIISKAISGR